MTPEPEPGPGSFLTLVPGTAVLDRFGQLVGEVERVLIAPASHFDGIIVDTAAGRRFVDAPEVRAIGHSAVVLAIVKHDVEHPGESGVLGAPSARWGRDRVVPQDREAVIAALKHAYVNDLVDSEQLAHAVGRAHSAGTFEELEALVPDALRGGVLRAGEAG